MVSKWTWGRKGLHTCFCLACLRQVFRVRYGLRSVEEIGWVCGLLLSMLGNVTRAGHCSGDSACGEACGVKPQMPHDLVPFSQAVSNPSENPQRSGCMCGLLV